MIIGGYGVTLCAPPPRVRLWPNVRTGSVENCNFSPPAENYILELIETLPQLDGLEKSFHSFYVCTAVRKFFFFLDPLRAGRIRIQDVLACSFLDDLLELRSDIIIIFYYLSVSKYTVRFALWKRN